MFILNNQRINIYAPYEAPDGTRYGNLTNPEAREALGVVEIPDPVPPEDYSDELYFRTEQQEAPYVVYTPRPAKAFKVQAQIAALEAQTLLPRVTREFMLQLFATQAAAAGTDPMENVLYRKVKEVNDTIAELRGQLGRVGCLP